LGGNTLKGVTMAKRRVNPSVGDITGKVGDLVHYTRKGKPCVRRAPVRKKSFRAGELKNQNRFFHAQEFAAGVLTDDVQRLRYEKAAAGTAASAQNVAVSDFFHAPVITDVDLTRYTGRAGEFIRIGAEEGRIGAAEVQVTIADRAKTVIEKGEATKSNDDVTWWYVSQKDLPPDQLLWITVTAVDQPRNRATKILRHLTGG
jgi:hypothetical protein